MKACKIILLCVIAFFGCNDNLVRHEDDTKGGICLTFDDAYVDEWYGISDLLIDNNIKATFFLTQPYKLKAREIKEMQELNSLGFEVGCHGYRHIDAVKYLESHTLQDYYNDEIEPALTCMHNMNLYPVSFAYPSGKNNGSLDTFLLEYFTILRDVAEEQRQPLTVEPNRLDDIFYRKGDTTVVAALGVDAAFNISEEQLKKAVERAKEKKEVIVFYMHCPVKYGAKNYQTNIEYLEYLISLVNEYELNSYTFSELAG